MTGVRQQLQERPRDPVPSTTLPAVVASRFGSTAVISPLDTAMSIFVVPSLLDDDFASFDDEVVVCHRSSFQPDPTVDRFTRTGAWNAGSPTTQRRNWAR